VDALGTVQLLIAQHLPEKRVLFQMSSAPICPHFDPGQRVPSRFFTAESGFATQARMTRTPCRSNGASISFVAPVSVISI
jgi:hypothetical protein